MSVALYIVLERKVEGFDHAVNGKALGRAGSALDRLAESAGVQPLMQFFSASPQESAAITEGEGIDIESTGIRLPPERWFPAEDGLKTVRALIQEATKGNIDRADRIVDDLKEFQNILETAKANGIGWHLAVDY
jgi:hypothetical protein